VTASLILRQLASYPRQNGVAAALRELGRLERTLFTFDWLEDPELRRETSRELNKGESRNSLARAVFTHRLGEIYNRTYENQQHRASGLNLLVTAIVLWNTRYLERAIAALREVEDVPDQLLAHLSPLGWEHVNLTGDDIWAALEQITENRDGLRPLRKPYSTAYQRQPDVHDLSALSCPHSRIESAFFPTPAHPRWCSSSDAGVQGRRRDRWTSVDLLSCAGWIPPVRFASGAGPCLMAGVGSWPASKRTREFPTVAPPPALHDRFSGWAYDPFLRRSVTTELMSRLSRWPR